MKKLQMKKLQLKKMKISKIDHINTIMGGFTNGDTEQGPNDLLSKMVKNDNSDSFVFVCDIPTDTRTDIRTASGQATGIANTDQCDGNG